MYVSCLSQAPPAQPCGSSRADEDTSLWEDRTQEMGEVSSSGALAWLCPGRGPTVNVPRRRVWDSKAFPLQPGVGTVTIPQHPQTRDQEEPERPEKTLPSPESHSMWVTSGPGSLQDT